MSKPQVGYTKHRLDITYRGNYVHMFKYKKAKYSRDDIQRIANESSQKLKEKGSGRIAIVMQFPNKPMSGRFVDFGVNPSLFSYLDSPGWEMQRIPIISLLSQFYFIFKIL